MFTIEFNASSNLINQKFVETGKPFSKEQTIKTDEIPEKYRVFVSEKLEKFLRYPSGMNLTTGKIKLQNISKVNQSKEICNAEILFDEMSVEHIFEKLLIEFQKFEKDNNERLDFLKKNEDEKENIRKNKVVEQAAIVEEFERESDEDIIQRNLKNGSKAISKWLKQEVNLNDLERDEKCNFSLKEQKIRVERLFEEIKRRTKEVEEESKKALKDWALAHGSELLILRIEENMNWTVLATEEFYTLTNIAIWGQGTKTQKEVYDSNDEAKTMFGIPNANIEQIKEIRAIRALEEKFPISEISLQRIRFEVYDEYDGENRVSHCDYIGYTLTAPNGASCEFLKWLNDYPQE